MITRRRAALAVTMAVVSPAALRAIGIFTFPPPVTSEEHTPFSGPEIDTEAIDNRLSRDIARVAFRVDSEEGVPVLLACINQVVSQVTREIPPARLTPWNSKVVTEMRQMTSAWQRLRPDCPPSDVARLIQILAERNLAPGAMEQKA